MDDESIDCTVTSPPYWALRDYGVGGQLGLEPTFQEYITKLCNIFDEVKRVLKKSGSCWVNIGDTYAGSGCGTNDYRTESNRSINGIGKNTVLYKTGGIAQKINYPKKSLCLIPFRFAIEVCDRGWILRNTIIWHKRNCMPQSIKDRFTVDFEYLFFFVKNRNYWFETQYEEQKEDSINRMKYDFGGVPGYVYPTEKRENPYPKEWKPKPLGRNKRCVWNISVQPFFDAHFAVFPEELIETPIKAGCPKDGVVLDPFIGSGTTGLVARKLLRHFIGFDLNPDYVKMAQDRLNGIPSRLESFVEMEATP